MNITIELFSIVDEHKAITEAANLLKKYTLEMEQGGNIVGKWATYRISIIK